MSYRSNSDSTTVSIKRTLKYLPNSFAQVIKSLIGPPDYADLYSDGSVRMKWNRNLSNGERLKVLELKSAYEEYIVVDKRSKKPHFDFDHPERAKDVSFVIKVIANPDQF